MYSPKIPERLIPALYRLARARGKPMTKIVAEALEAYLASQHVVLVDQVDDISSHQRQPPITCEQSSAVENAMCRQQLIA